MTPAAIRKAAKEAGGGLAARIFIVYPDVGGRWRWRTVSRHNGQTVGGSQESFSSKSAASRAARHEASFYLMGKAVVITAPPKPTA